MKGWRPRPRSSSKSIGRLLPKFIIHGLLLFIGTANAQRPQPLQAPERAPSCTVKRTDDDEAALAHISFTGRVRQGTSYRCAFIQGLTFLLTPIEGGWIIEIREEGGNDDLAEPTAPFSGRNPLKIVGEDFPGSEAQGTGSGTPRTPPYERAFKISRPCSGHGSVTITNMSFGGQQQTDVAEMSFDASIDIRALEGMPLYGAMGTSPPKPVRTAGPSYPDSARRRHIQGVVVLYLTVGVDGRTRNIRVTRSIESDLDAAAIETVRRWQFKPAMRNGHSVPVEISVQVQFRSGPF